MCKFVNNTKRSRIDECMREFIMNLNQLFKANNITQLEIVASCCGHGKYPMTIVIRNNSLCYQELKRGMTYDLVSGKEIPRKRNFYKKDKQGYYYIPEVVEVGR